MNNKHKPSISFTDTFRQLRPYLLVFFISLLILEGFVFFFNAGFGHLVPSSLHPVLNLFNAFAGVSFCFYLKHTKSFENLSEDFCILLSVSYGLCAYGLLQEINLRYLAVFALFPLLFYTYEKMMSEDRAFCYILLLTLCFFSDYMLTAIVLATLTVHVLLFAEGGIGVHLRAFFRFAGLSCVALLISGFITFPQYAEYFSYIKANPYSGFSTTLPAITALSRFLLGSVSSAAFFSGMRMDLYFGLFFFMMTAFYFLLPDVGGKEKRKSFLFIFFLFAAVQFSPIYFLVNFFRMYSGGSIYYSFLLIFFLLLLASRALVRAASFRSADILKLGVFSILYLTVCLYCAGHNYHILAKQSNIFFVIAYIALLFVFSLRRKISFPVKPLLVCFTVLELVCNIFIVTNQDFIPAPLELADHYPDLSSWQAYPGLNNDEKPVPATNDQAESNARQYLATELTEALNTLPDTEILTSEDKEAAGITGLSDFFTIENAIVRKLGAKEDLFLPAKFTLDFAESDFYQTADLGNHIYSFSYLHDTLHPYIEMRDMSATISADREGTLIILDSMDMQLYRIDMDGKGSVQNVVFSLPLASEYTINNLLNGYWLNSRVLNQLPSLLEAYEASQQSSGSSAWLLPYYLGIAATCLGILIVFFLFINRDKEKIYAYLGMLGKKLENSRILSATERFVYENRIYLLSFLIPFGFFLLALIINSCTPFGSNSILDEDGLYLTYPLNLDVYYNLKEGHTLYSFLGGYGYNLYAVAPLAVTRILTLLLRPGQIAALLTLEEGFNLGLSGLFLAVYFTHRLTGEKALKTDNKILVSVMIYTLNSYMLCMHGYTSWYQTFLALPLLFLAMDYLMQRKKCLPYIIALAYCIYVNLYLALYICIFLIIRFFVYHFTDFKDFLLKGLRFAGCSILAALDSFFIISNTLLSSYDSPYRSDDSVFPVPGFHGNFFSQWKQHMIFSEIGAVNWSESYISLYAGIGAVILILIFCFFVKIKPAEKLRTLLPFAILYISFNGRLLSYIWNGFHYQSSVPNRYVFLLMLLIAILAYDTLHALDDLSFARYCTVFSAALIFFAACQFIGSGNSVLSFTATTGVILIYAVILLCMRFRKKTCQNAFAILLAAELLLNMLYAFRQYDLSGIYRLGDIEYIQQVLDELDNQAPPLARTIYAATPYKNGGAFYNTESNEIFNSFVTRHQTYTNMRYGMTGGGNFTTTSNASLPVGVSLSGTHLLYYSYITENACEDLAEYRYLGNIDGNYVFENPYTLPIGIYAPYEAAKLEDDSMDNDSIFVPYYLDDLSSLYLPEGETLFSHQIISYDESGKGKNIFYYTDENDRILSFDEVNDILNTEKSQGNTLTPLDNLYINISVTPESDGPLYLYFIEFISLGYAQKGVPFTCRNSFPSSYLPASNDLYNLSVFKSENMPDFYESASQYVLEDISYEGHTLKGTTDYAEDGYTILSIPYDRGWKAYIDGKEVPIEDPYQSMMFVKTPAGHHELTLKFIPYGMIQSLLVTGGSISFTALLFFIISRLKRKQPRSIT